MRKTTELLREILCLGIAFAVSWWFLLRQPEDAAGLARLAAPRQSLPMELVPLLLPEGAAAEQESTARAPPGAAPEQAQEAETEVVDAPAPSAESSAPPPPELGSPEGETREERIGRTADPGPLEATVVQVEQATSVAAGSVEVRAPSVEPAATGSPAPTEVAEATPPQSEASPPAGPREVPPAEARVPAELPLAAPIQEEPTPLAREDAPAAAPPASAAREPPGDAPARNGDDARGAREVSALMRDPSLLATAGAEIAGEERRGFATVLLATPEDQLAIARFFGEELVLVPREALDPEASEPHWFRVATESAQVEEVRGRPPLERYRQYRDLFDYDYARLPDALRDLRRRLVSRRDVYVFAALIPAREWAVVVARRGEALARSGRELSEVRRFVLRYLELAEGAFDLTVDQIVFADGSRYPLHSPAEKGTRTQ